MFRSARRRLLGILLATLSILGSAAEPLRAHACHMHAPMAMAVHGSGEAGGVAAARRVRQVSRAGDTDAPPASAPCTCAGPCQSGAVPLAAGGVVRATVDAPVVSFAAALPWHAYVAAWVDFVFPPTTAPPALARA